MRLLIQRVDHASVFIDQKLHSSIKRGLLVFIGIAQEDEEEDVDYLSSKLIQLRIFPDKENKMNLSVLDITGEILLISQFTLFASTKKGNRPSFLASALPVKAIPLYEKFKLKLESAMPGAVKSGVFGADMQVELLNSGPVTLLMDSRNKE